MSQMYQDYWKLTVEYSDIHGEKFLNTLKIIVDFIDYKSKGKFSQELYKELQDKIYNKYPKKDMGSVRKSINQFVKLGFINFELSSYHNLTHKFLQATTDRRRLELFSNIFYSNSKLNASVTTNSKLMQINFLLKTLEEVGKLSKEQIMGLMTVDIESFYRGFLLKTELSQAVNNAEKIGFDNKKYNQISYLLNFLGKLNGVVFVHNELFFEEDAIRIFGNKLNDIGETKRDSYLHRNYKIALKKESIELYKKEVCMVEKLDYPVLIASHIKPWIDSDENEKYDPNNGLLLSRNIDSLFDLNHITFDNDGKIIFSHLISDEIKNHLKGYSLDKAVLNEERLKYLKYHQSKLKLKT